MFLDRKGLRIFIYRAEIDMRGVDLKSFTVTAAAELADICSGQANS